MQWVAYTAPCQPPVRCVLIVRSVRSIVVPFATAAAAPAAGTAGRAIVLPAAAAAAATQPIPLQRHDTGRTELEESTCRDGVLLFAAENQEERCQMLKSSPFLLYYPFSFVDITHSGSSVMPYVFNK